MTNAQKEYARLSIQVARESVQRIVDGQSDAETLGQRRDYVDWHLCHLLSRLIPALPRDLRAEVQACYDLREQVWSEDYMNQYYAQQKASPSCLQASDSL